MHLSFAIANRGVSISGLCLPLGTVAEALVDVDSTLDLLLGLEEGRGLAQTARGLLSLVLPASRVSNGFRGHLIAEYPDFGYFHFDHISRV